jgi:hypothetical protein
MVTDLRPLCFLAKAGAVRRDTSSLIAIQAANAGSPSGNIAAAALI